VSPLVSRSWSLIDFVLIWFGGLLGSAAVFATNVALDDERSTILLGLIGQYAGSLLVFWLLSRRKGQPDIGLQVKGGDFVYLGLGLIFQIGVALLLLPLATRLFPDGRPRQLIAEQMAEADTMVLQVGFVVSALVMGPVVEELTYRGVLLRSLSRLGQWPAVILSSIVFMAIHIPGLSPSAMLESAVLILPPLFVLAVILARLTQRTGRLGPAIFVHSGWNLLAALVFLLPEDLIDQVG
jgi:membrane protease YdiL (CAAX protease family)